MSGSYGKEYMERMGMLLRNADEESERKISIAIGKSPSYVNKVKNGEIMPAMDAFFDICDYFEITPQQFWKFESVSELTPDGKMLIECTRSLSEERLKHLASFAGYLVQQDLEEKNAKAK